MAVLPRRAFLGAALAAPLAACATLPMSETPAAARADHGTLVRSGQDRTGQPRTVFGGLRLDTKVAPADTEGDLYVIQHTDTEKGGPPRHVPHAQDEWFYVLTGAYRVQVGDETFEVGAGDAVFAPRGVPHVWAHVSEGEGRLLIAFQPAGQMEAFLGALAALGAAPTPDIMGPLFAAHGMTMLGPPLDVG
jgi:quercetin dioxygenase-like cupin family protein